MVGERDWVILRKIKSSKRADLFCDRVKSEFKYASVIPWPIYDRKEGGRIMYHMIHATDHPIAPNLMYRAYNTAVRPKESMEQLHFEFEQWTAQR